MEVIIELVDNGATMEYPELGFKCVVPGTDKDIAHELANDIIQEMTDRETSKKLKVEIKISPI